MAPKKKEQTQAPESLLPVKMPEFVLKKQKSYEVEGNFEEVEQFLRGQVARYKSVAFTQENIDQVLKVKDEVKDLRISLTKIQTTTKAERFNQPKGRFDTKMDALIAIAVEVETVVDTVLDAEDQKRKDDVTKALESYKEHFQTVYSLQDTYLAQIEFKQSYYNKTAKEKESKNDLELQFKTLKADQTARAGNEKLIKNALKDTPTINEAEQIAKLDRGMDIASVLEWIEGEKQRLTNLPPPGSGPGGLALSPAAEAGAKMKTVLGVVKKLDLASDIPAKTKTTVIALTYPVDVADSITALFQELAKHDVVASLVKPEELVGGKLSR